MRAFHGRWAEVTGCGISWEIGQTTGCGPFIGCGPCTWDRHFAFTLFEDHRLDCQILKHFEFFGQSLWFVKFMFIKNLKRSTVFDWSKPLIQNRVFFYPITSKPSYATWRMCARKIPLDYRRHLEMQVSDCLVTYIFPSTSTLLNPLRLSSQSFAGRVALFDNPSFLLFSLVFHSGFVPNSITFSNPISKRLNLWDGQTDKQTN